jgi:hypothetical protein
VYSHSPTPAFDQPHKGVSHGRVNIIRQLPGRPLLAALLLLLLLLLLL